MDSALKSCDALQAKMQAKLDATSSTDYTLTITTSEDLKGPKAVRSCEGNTKKADETTGQWVADAANEDRRMVCNEP